MEHSEFLTSAKGINCHANEPNKINFDRLLSTFLRSPEGHALEHKENTLKCKVTGKSYPIINGIPNFISGTETSEQNQVKESFSYKWTRTPGWGITSEGSRDIMTPWMINTLGWPDEESYRNYLSQFRIILDAGCGNGRETIRLATLNPDALIIGLDFSEGIYSAAKFAKDLPNVRFVRADLCNPPFAPATFDHILSFGVLHHTANTRHAFEKMVSLLALEGEFTFYVYKKKAPMREFADDHIRHAIRNMPAFDAWSEMEKITLLGKALSDLKVEIEIPEIKSLGLEAGKHDLQRLIYYTMLKCYWNNEISFEDNVHVNYDWYAPEFAWRHTLEEVESWIEESGLKLIATKSIHAGFTFRVKRL